MKRFPLMPCWLVHLTLCSGAYLFVAAILFAVPLHAGNESSSLASTDDREQEVIKMLSNGEQDAAEDKIHKALAADPRNSHDAFIASVLSRSRFDVSNAAPGFFLTMSVKPDSVDGLASACILAMDSTRSPATALHFLSALIALSKVHPDNLWLHWMIAVETRTITRDANYGLTQEQKNMALRLGVIEYEKLLAGMAPGTGPVLIHQTMANLLDSLEAYDESLKHRETAVWMEREPWSLEGAGETLNALARFEEAIPLLEEAIQRNPKLDNGSYAALASAYLHLGKPREALEVWDHAIRNIPSNASFPANAALIYRNEGDYAKARDLMRQAVAADPKNAYCKIMEARFSALNGEFDAPARVMAAGSLDFKGNADPKPLTAESDPFRQAVLCGDLSKAREMLGESGLAKGNIVDINAAPGALKQTALMIAAQSGWEQIAGELIRHGADVNAVDQNGDTALHYSAQFKQPRVMKLLLEAGAKSNLVDRWKQTPLIMSCTQRDLPSVVMLVEHKADINQSTPGRGTALHTVASWGDLPIVQYLLSQGADVNLPTGQWNQTPLISACREWHHVHLVTPFLAAGARINDCDQGGKSALHCSVSRDLDPPLVDALLAQGADPLLKDTSGVTPIAKSRCLGYEEVAATMEKKVGHSEVLVLPAPDLSKEDEFFANQASRSLLIPFLMECGRYPVPGMADVPNRRDAVQELSSSFLVKSAADLTKRIEALQTDESRLPPPSKNANSSFLILQGMINHALQEVGRQYSSQSNEKEVGKAWRDSRILWLNFLGARAGYLSKEEAVKSIGESAQAILGTYSNWNAYLRDFVVGAQLGDGLNHQRYENIAALIQNSGIPWPSK